MQNHFRSLDERRDGWARSGDRLTGIGGGGFWRDCIHAGLVWFDLGDVPTGFCDLTPLSRFIERVPKFKPFDGACHKCGAGMYFNRMHQCEGDSYTVHVLVGPMPTPSKMYGPIWPVDETPPKPEPKSAADKALEDVAEFERKRIAKREQAKRLADSGAHIPCEQTTRENERAKALDRALSRAFVHHTPFTERLAGYRGIPLPALSKAETGAGGVR